MIHFFLMIVLVSCTQLMCSLLPNKMCPFNDRYEEPQETLTCFLQDYFVNFSCEKYIRPFLYPSVQEYATDNTVKIDIHRSHLAYLKQATIEILMMKEKLPHIVKLEYLRKIYIQKIVQEHEYLSKLYEEQIKNRQPVVTERDVVRFARWLRGYQSEIRSGNSPIYQIVIADDAEETETLKPIINYTLRKIIESHKTYNTLMANRWIRCTPHPDGVPMPWYLPKYFKDEQYKREFGPVFREVAGGNELLKYYNIKADPRVKALKKRAKALKEEVTKKQELQALCTLPPL
jgi:hypothetical protein